MASLLNLIAALRALRAHSEKAPPTSLDPGCAAKLFLSEGAPPEHPRVSVIPEPEGVRLSFRMGRPFGWFWLLFTSVHCGILFYCLSRGSLKINGTIVGRADWRHYLGLGFFYAPFFVIGLAFTLARYRVLLQKHLISIRFRILPYLGWTWVLPVGDTIRVALVFRGSRQNRRPVESIVIASMSRETHFGAFLPRDVKSHVARVIFYFYHGITRVV